MKNPVSCALIAAYCLIAGFLTGCVFATWIIFDAF